MKLYSYFRSSAAYRVRIALNLKNLPYDIVPIHLVKNGGEQLSDSYREINPAGLVPALIDDEKVFSQSLAIIEYLEETYPNPALLPKNAADRAWVRSLALSVACDIHPLNNLRVLRHLVKTFQADEESKNTWYRHWCELGFASIETMLEKNSRVGAFCFGETPTIADCLLIPQVYNAMRFQCDMTQFPTIVRINQQCLSLAAFADAAPEKQPDAE